MTTKTYKVTIDYNKSVKQLLKAGKYTYINEDYYNLDCKPTKKGKVQATIKVLHFDRYITSKEVLAEMKKNNIRPANVVELLTFANQFGSEELNWLVGLGTTKEFGGFVRAPCVWFLEAERKANLGYFGRDWRDFSFVGLLGESSDSGELETGSLETLPSVLNINGVEYVRKV